MILEVYEQEDSLESIILGIQADLPRKAFHEMARCVPSADISLKLITDKNGETPRFIKNGVVVKTGAYPEASEFASWLGLDVSIFNDVSQGGDLFAAANNGRISACCGVGTDVYLDPYEESSEE